MGFLHVLGADAGRAAAAADEARQSEERMMLSLTILAVELKIRDDLFQNV
jgi:hypothetical protein